MYDITLKITLKPRLLMEQAHWICQTLHTLQECEGSASSRRGNATRGTAERGQVVVEYALVGTVIFFLMLGLIDFGRAVWTYSSVSTAAREGARYAMVRGYECLRQQYCTAGSETKTVPLTPCNASWVSPIVEKACSYLAGIDLSRARVEVTLPYGGNNPGQPVRVRVEADYTPVTLLIFRSVGNLTLRSVSEQIITF